MKQRFFPGQLVYIYGSNPGQIYYFESVNGMYLVLNRVTKTPLGWYSNEELNPLF
jgi:hypothetical protein